MLGIRLLEGIWYLEMRMSLIGWSMFWEGDVILEVVVVIVVR